MTITHIAGIAIHIEGKFRQRCGWCGAILVEEYSTDVQPRSWEVGEQVRDHGIFHQWVKSDDGVLPDDSCTNQPEK